MNWNPKVRAYLHLPEQAAIELASNEGNLCAMRTEDELSRSADLSLAQRCAEILGMEREDENAMLARQCEQSPWFATHEDEQREPMILTALLRHMYQEFVDSCVRECVASVLAEERQAQLQLEEETGWKLSVLLSRDVYLATKAIWDDRKTQLSRLYRQWCKRKRRGNKDGTLAASGPSLQAVATLSSCPHSGGDAPAKGSVRDGIQSRPLARQSLATATSHVLSPGEAPKQSLGDGEDTDACFLDENELFESSEDDELNATPEVRRARRDWVHVRGLPDPDFTYDKWVALVTAERQAMFAVKAAEAATAAAMFREEQATRTFLAQELARAHGERWAMRLEEFAMREFLELEAEVAKLQAEGNLSDVPWLPAANKRWKWTQWRQKMPPAAR
jgi:hypothetical protein